MLVTPSHYCWHSSYWGRWVTYSHLLITTASQFKRDSKVKRRGQCNLPSTTDYFNRFKWCLSTSHFSCHQSEVLDFNLSVTNDRKSLRVLYPCVWHIWDFTLCYFAQAQTTHDQVIVIQLWIKHKNCNVTKNAEYSPDIWNTLSIMC